MFYLFYATKLYLCLPKNIHLSVFRLKNLLQEREFQVRVREERSKLFSDEDQSEEVCFTGSLQPFCFIC